MQGQAPWWKVSAAKKHFLARRETKNTAFVVQDLKTTTDNIHIILYRLPYHNRPSSACWESSCLQEPWCLLSNLVLSSYQVLGAEYQWFSDAKSSKPQKNTIVCRFSCFFSFSRVDFGPSAFENVFPKLGTQPYQVLICLVVLVGIRNT